MFCVAAWNPARPTRTGRTRLRILVGTVLLAMVTTLMVGLDVSSPANAVDDPGNATISGNIKGQGTPNVNLEGVEVIVSDATDASNYLGVKTTQTDIDGNYVVTGLYAGTYTVAALPPHSTSGPEFLDAQWGRSGLQELGAPFTVAPGEAVVGKDFVLALGATISGNVKGAGSPDVNVSGVRVTLNSDNRAWGWIETDSNGDYTLTGIPSGRYWISFSAQDTYLPKWWGGGLDAATALPISAIAGQTITGKNTVLQAGATISGNLKYSDTPYSNASGQTVQLESVNWDDYYYLSATTDLNGNYSFSGVKPGVYTIDSYPDSDFYAATWVGGTSQLGAEHITVVGTEAVTGKNAVFPLGATVSGTVYAAGTPDTPLEDVYVAVLDSTTGNDVGGAYSGIDGTYSIGGVGPGNYTIEFDAEDYATSYWQGKSAFEDADVFTITEGQTVIGKDAVLTSSAIVLGSVSGNVKGQGSPAVNLEKAGVWVYTADTGSYVKSTTTGSDGNYTIADLPPGTYTLEFSADDYIGQWWSNQVTQETATSFSVSAGESLTGKDAVLSLGGTISGAITNSSNVPLNASVVVYQSGGAADNDETLVKASTLWTSKRDATTGAYTISGLPVGSYKVGFTTYSTGYSSNAMKNDHSLGESYPYVAQWFGGAYSYSTATTVTISTPNQAVTGVDAVVEYPSFEDAADPTSPFYGYIQWMSASGLSTGTAQSEGKALYKPSSAVSRQAMAAFLYRLSGSSFTPPVEPTFADVPTDYTFYTAIEWMAHEGISTGTAQPSGKPLFKPGNPVSRSAMALFLARYEHADLSGTPTTQRFADVPLNSGPAAAITWMWDNGISTGTAQESGLPLYKPSDPVSRQAMAAFLYRVAHLAS